MRWSTFFVILVGCIVPLILQGQTTPKQQALVVKKTATWCSNCGSWGWTWFKDLLKDTENDNVIALNLHSTSSNLKPPLDLDGTWLSHFNVNVSFPTFYANGVSKNTYPELLSSAKTLASQPPVVGIQVQTGLVDNVVQAVAELEWLAFGNEDYSVGFYIVEDSLVAFQAVQGNNALHRFVVRESFEGKHFGNSLVLEHQPGDKNTISAQHNYTLLSAARHHILVIVWKKSGLKQVYVNSAMVRLQEGPISSTEPHHADVSWDIYPNPAKIGGEIYLKTGEERKFDRGISLYDHIGRNVGVLDLQRSKDGEFRMRLPTNLSPGVYSIVSLEGHRLISRPITLIR